MLKYEELPEVNSERWLSLEDLEGEEWRYIDGTENSYMVSNYGRVKSLSCIRKNHHSHYVKKERIRRLGYSKKGYPCVSLTVKCVKVVISAVHILVAKTFIPNLENKPQVDHINTIRTDNRVCNLRWVTNKENAYNPLTHAKVHAINGQKGVRHHTEETKKVLGEQKRGENNPHWGKTGKLCYHSVPVIQLTLNGKFVKEWECIRQANEVYKGHISCCCRGKRKSAAGYKWVYKKDYCNTLSL